ncbi:MAG: ABC transporter permease [Negativicutes bacterium]
MKYLLKRILSIIPVLFITSVIVFLIIHLIPGDPAEIVAGPGVPRDEVENIRRLMGLDKPLITQYFDWLFRALTGDFGISLTSRDPIFPLVMTRFGNTLILSLLGISFAVVIGIPLGILSAVKQNSLIDIAVMIISIIGISMPIFWLGLILVKFFSIEWRLLPATGSGGLLNLVLPSVTVGLNSLAIIARMTRASMLEVLRQDYITTAEAKGLGEMTIIFRHALKNALIPIVTTIGIQFGYLMGGAVLTETVFVYPGLGRLLVDSIRRMDYPVVQACILLIATMFILVNLLVDLLYVYLNPKIKYGN